MNASLVVACPHCHQLPNQPCVSGTGRQAGEPHAARRRTARHATTQVATGWTLRVVWPIENPELFNTEAVRLAEADLPEVAAYTGAVVVGTPSFRVVDCDRGQSWPTTPTAVVCEVDALPAVTRIGTTSTARSAA